MILRGKMRTVKQHFRNSKLIQTSIFDDLLSMLSVSIARLRVCLCVGLRLIIDSLVYLLVL